MQTKKLNFLNRIGISAVLFTLSASSYAISCGEPTYTQTAPATQSSEALSNESEDKGHGSIFPDASKSLALSHFTWGADLGSSIDLTGHDMSTFDIDVVFGYKNPLIRIVGVGVGMHKSFGANNMFVPIYAIFRTSFRTKPSLLFFNLKAGYSFSTIQDSPTFGDVSASIGLGINLAMSRRFQSHIIIGCSFRHFTERHQALVNLDTENVALANISFGVNF